MQKKVSNLEILKRAARRHGYAHGLIDSPYSEAIFVTDGESYFISRSKKKYGMYPINYKFAEHLADDKSVTKRVLKKFGFRVIKGKLFYIKNPNTDGTPLKKKDAATSAYTYAKKISYPVFVKPNSGSQGANAHIIFNETALKKHVAKMRKEDVLSFLVEKFTERPEYRIFVVGGKAQFMYRKKRFGITGTGKHTIQELIKKNNLELDTQYLANLLKNKKKTVHTVLDSDQELTLQETGNVSLGSQIVDYRDKFPKEVDKWTNRLHRLTGLEVFGVDVFTKGNWNEPTKYLIIELNSNPALSGIYSKGHKEKVYDIWGKIMKKYFLSK